MELNRLFLLTIFLLHIKLSRMIPTRLVCDRRLIQKYISDSMELENQVNQCDELPLLQQPVLLPLVGFSLREWMAKTNQVKGQEVLRDLLTLVDGIAATQQELKQPCPSVLLQQLYGKASFFVLHLQSYGSQEPEATRQPEGTPELTSETNLRMIFQTYRQLLQGKLHFFFNDLRKEFSCGVDRHARSSE
ncbi:thrombopoietin [Anolis sagrei]|uniref:thrombopoietin n=1 Tax=Anolis sagrei TaxID=38937 RepID=UPI00352255CA